jgi:uncharacterized membrane protein
MAKETNGKTRARKSSTPTKSDPKSEESEASEPGNNAVESRQDSDDAEVLEGLHGSEVPEEVVQLAMRYAGPLPPPRMLSQYNDALPDGAHRIVTSWENEGDHRRKLQNRGQWIAAGLGFAAIVAAVVCALSGQPWVGGSIIAFTMLAMGATGAVGQILSITRKRQ